MFAAGEVFLMAIGAVDGWKFVLILLAIVIPLGMALASIADVAKSRFKSSTHKLLWLLAAMLVPVVGPLLYLFVGIKQKIS